MSDTQPEATSQTNSSARAIDPKGASAWEPRLHPEWIDSHATGIVKALQKAGHESYLVGGCVRDLMLGIIPKDFDIATMAHPPQVKRLIHMAFIIGKRFRLVLVKRGEQQFEVATFRKEFDPSEFPIEEYPDGPPSVDNIFGTPEEDAKRRDFTINALFYDPVSQELIDYVGGRADIESRTLRMIGQPDKRLVEDPIRILRAIRFAHKLQLVIEPALRDSMACHSKELQRSVLPRRREELLKLLRLEDPTRVLVECHDLGVLREIFPSIEKMFASNERQETFLALLENFKSSVMDFANTGQVFAWLLSAITEAYHEEGTAFTEDDLTVVMRDELGMYKFEQSLVLDAIKLRRSLERTDEHKRRGERRQAGLVRREGFQLALRLASADYRLSGPDVLFWNEVVKRLQPEIEEAKRDREERQGARRGGRGRRRNRRGENRANSTADLDDADVEAEENEADDITDEMNDENIHETEGADESSASSVSNRDFNNQSGN
jgi:poly(A) polymerase